MQQMFFFAHLQLSPHILVMFRDRIVFSYNQTASPVLHKTDSSYLQDQVTKNMNLQYNVTTSPLV